MRKLPLLATALAFGMAACTVHEADVPSVSGPSAVALSVTVTATPDTIPQDGVATSRIAIKAFNAGGKPYPSLAVRLDMMVNGTIQDLGTLSARTLVTGTDGTATATYTSPAGPGPGAIGSTLAVVATPIASDAANTGILNSVGALFQAYLHLVPAGNVVPPKTETPTAAFVVTPNPPAVGAIALFNGTSSCPSSTSGGVTPSCNAATSTVTNWDWDFGDGTPHGSGSIATHTYQASRPFAVVLTVTNSMGVSASTITVITPSIGVFPTALFSILPTPASVGGEVTLDATASTSSGALISYVWNITDPNGGLTITSSAGPIKKFTPTIAGVYTINLSVQDSAGRTAASGNKNLTVQ
jgi:PKD repeat protein